MKTRNSILLLGLAMTGMVGLNAASAADEFPYAGRRVDHVPVGIAAAQQENPEMLGAVPADVIMEPAYSGRRTDHLLMLSALNKERAEFSTMEGGAAEHAAPLRIEPAYSGRRADHPEILLGK